MPRVSADYLAARREQILDGARECFGRFGYEGATVRRLETAIGLSRGTIFHHFRDKDTLFLELAHQDATRMTRSVAQLGIVHVMREMLAESRSDGSSIDWLATRLDVARRLGRDPVLRAGWQRHTQELIGAIGNRLHEERQAGVIRTDLRLDVLTRYLALTFEGFVSLLATGEGRDSGKLSAVLDMVETSVRPPPRTLIR